MTQKLKNEILRMAEKHEKSWEESEQLPENNSYFGHYTISLYSCKDDNEWSYPAYLLLKYNWNDALDWANA